MRYFLVLLALLVAATPVQAQIPVRISVGADTVSFTVNLAFDSIHFNTRVETLVVVHVDTLWCAADGACSSVKPPVPLPVSVGVPFGPIGGWVNSQPVYTGIEFTASQNYTSPQNVVTMIANARARQHHLILVMTGGGPELYSTNGKFDLTKWKKRMDEYNTPAIRQAVTAAVADETVIANSIMDEPEHRNWGGVMTKPILDSMAAYGKRYFPTLPMGPSNGPTGFYQWRTAERYGVVDYTLNQYNYWVTNGDAKAFKDKVLARAKIDSVAVAFGINILDGGQNAPGGPTGSWICPVGTSAGRGSYAPACRMTPSQIRLFGRALAPTGCFFEAWRQDQKAMADSGNVSAFNDVLTAVKGVPRKACRRS